MIFYSQTFFIVFFTEQTQTKRIMTTATMTQIIPEHPGYYWYWEKDQWQIYWEPVNRWYSPPRLHPEIVKYEFQVPLWFQEKIGLLIGRQGCHFIRITRQSGCHYIYYLAQSNKIEIWGYPNNIYTAIKSIKNLMYKITQQTQ